MKKLFVQFILVLACMGLSVAFAQEQSTTKSQKDECLLISKDCANATLSIQQKMKKLNAEIKKGTKVYTPAELKRLQDKLKDAEDTLDLLLSRNPSFCMEPAARPAHYVNAERQGGEHADDTDHTD